MIPSSFGAPFWALMLSAHKWAHSICALCDRSTASFQKPTAFSHDSAACVAPTVGIDAFQVSHTSCCALVQVFISSSACFIQSAIVASFVTQRGVPLPLYCRTICSACLAQAYTK